MNIMLALLLAITSQIGNDVWVQISGRQDSKGNVDSTVTVILSDVDTILPYYTDEIDKMLKPPTTKVVIIGKRWPDLNPIRLWTDTSDAKIIFASDLFEKVGEDWKSGEEAIKLDSLSVTIESKKYMLRDGKIVKKSPK